jgi:hypothetical protein
MNERPARPAHRAPLAMRVWGNPLARGSDRAEVVLTVALIVAWLLSVPIFATIASAQWPSVESQVAGTEHSVTATEAVLLSDADVVIADPHSSSVIQPTATATWTGRDGRPVTGSIVVRVGARIGDRQTIWLDEQGTVVDRPMTTATAAGLLVLAAAGGWLALGALFLAFRRAAGWSLERRRRQMWEAEWASFDAGSRST